MTLNRYLQTGSYPIPSKRGFRIPLLTGIILAPESGGVKQIFVLLSGWCLAGANSAPGWLRTVATAAIEAPQEGCFADIFGNRLAGRLRYYRRNCYNPLDMAAKLVKRPRCSRCGECCRTPVILMVNPEDHCRWTRQGRLDILQYASAPLLPGYGDLWINIDGSQGSGHCPFISKVSPNQYICKIHHTKPAVCQEFRCEWAYGAGKKGIPFKTERGWTDKAKQLGYGQTNNRSRRQR